MNHTYKRASKQVEKNKRAYPANPNPTIPLNDSSPRNLEIVRNTPTLPREHLRYFMGMCLATDSKPHNDPSSSWSIPILIHALFHPHRQAFWVQLADNHENPGHRVQMVRMKFSPFTNVSCSSCLSRRMQPVRTTPNKFQWGDHKQILILRDYSSSSCCSSSSFHHHSRRCSCPCPHLHPHLHHPQLYSNCMRIR